MDLLFAREVIDLVNHLVVGALHAAIHAHADGHSNGDADADGDNEAKQETCGVLRGYLGGNLCVNLIGIPGNPDGDGTAADGQLGLAVLLHLHEFAGCLNEVFGHAVDVHAVDEVFGSE